MRLTRVVRIFKMSKNFQGLMVRLAPAPAPAPALARTPNPHPTTLTLTPTRTRTLTLTLPLPLPLSLAREQVLGRTLYRSMTAITLLLTFVVTPSTMQPQP